MSRIKDMTVGSPTKLIATFAFPLIRGNLGQQLYMIVDAIIVGQGVGVEALASLGASDWIYWLVLWTVQAIPRALPSWSPRSSAQATGRGSNRRSPCR